MTAKEYLSQAYRLDLRINSKIEQIANLNDLATKATSVATGMPHSPNKGKSNMADTIARIIDLQEEINNDIDKLVELKAEIISVIKKVDNSEYQTLLEKRFLCYMTWESIAVDMGFSIQHLYRLRDKAYERIRIPER